MTKNKLFYFLFNIILTFLFFFIIEMNAFNTVKDFFNKSIENFKKGYKWITQNDRHIEENKTVKEKKIYKNEKKPLLFNDISNIDNNLIKNNIKVGVSNQQENNTEEGLKNIDKEKKLEDILEKLLKDDKISYLSNFSFREQFIAKYNKYIEKKNEKKNDIEKIPLLQEDEFEKKLNDFNKNNSIKKDIKKYYIKKKFTKSFLHTKNNHFSKLNSASAVTLNNDNKDNIYKDTILENNISEGHSSNINNASVDNVDNQIENQIASLLMTFPKENISNTNISIKNNVKKNTLNKGIELKENNQNIKSNIREGNKKTDGDNKKYLTSIILN